MEVDCFGEMPSHQSPGVVGVNRSFVMLCCADCHFSCCAVSFVLFQYLISTRFNHTVCDNSQDYKMGTCSREFCQLFSRIDTVRAQPIRDGSDYRAFDELKERLTSNPTGVLGRLTSVSPSLWVRYTIGMVLQCIL